jgi:pyrroline-5-carboxylate reductase
MSLWQSYRALAPRTRLFIGGGIMAYAAFGLLASDQAEQLLGWTATEEDRKRLKERRGPNQQVKGHMRERGIRNCLRHLEACFMPADILELLEGKDRTDLAHSIISTTANWALANTKGNAPATQELWSLVMPIFRNSRLELGSYQDKNSAPSRI